MPAGPRRNSTLVTVAVTAFALIVAGGIIWAVREITRTTPQPHCEVAEGSVRFQFSTTATRHAATIAGVANDLGLPRRAVTIAEATAIQESGLRNLDHGDRDSLGLFQQRPSQGWGTPEQIQDPVYAATAFYRALTKVDGWQDGELTVVAQEVQRSGFPDAYAEHEWEGRVLSAAFTGAEGGQVGCLLTDPETPGDPDSFATALARETPAKGSVAGRSVVVDMTTPAAARAIGAWAVAGASEFGVTRVSVGTREWRRSPDPESLRWSDGPVTPGTRVTVRFD